MYSDTAKILINMIEAEDDNTESVLVGVGINEYKSINKLIIDLPVWQCQPYHDYNFIGDIESQEELDKSVSCFGIINPVIVRPLGNSYEVVAGNRRCESARKLGIGRVPAIIK